MAPKGGTFFFLLILACAALAMKPDRRENKQDFKNMARRLMKKCHNKGYQVPPMTLLKSVFDDSDLPMGERNTDHSKNVLSTFIKVLQSVSPVKGSKGRVAFNDMDKMPNKMLNCSDLSNVIKRMRNSSEASKCYLEAFLAPLSLATLNKKSEDNTDSDDYDTLLSAAKLSVLNMPSSRMNLPAKVVGRDKTTKWMKMLQEGYPTMSEKQRRQVVKWAKEQITLNYHNCTTSKSISSKVPMKRCKPSLQWLNSEALTAMGPFLSGLTPKDVDASPKEKLCEFFRLNKFKAHFRLAPKMKPSLGKKLLQRFKECFQEESAEQVDKLGQLSCYYSAPQKMTPDLSRKLLAQLEECDDDENPKIKKLKKNLVNSLMSKSNITQTLGELGISLNSLTAKQLSKIPDPDIKTLLKKLRPKMKWKRRQLRALVKKYLGKKKCNGVSAKELLELRSVAGGLPRCVLKHVRSKDILHDKENLKNMCNGMKKGQLKAMLQGLREDVDPTDLVQNLPDSLLRSVSLQFLAKANISSLDQLKGKVWSRSQAAFLAKRMYNQKKLKFRGLRSVLQGITCKMINEAADTDVQDMAESIEDTPQWLSKVLARCAARKLFRTLEKERDDYFKNITEEEMDDIPTILLLHLPPQKVKDLPDYVCPILLDKMEVANLSSLPLRAPSRAALTLRAVFCMANGTDLSGLTTEDVSKLGPLLCELPPSQLRLMAPDVLKSSLEAMASCQQIPKRHSADLIQLVKQNYGDFSDWSAETMEALGPLLLLDDTTTSALPNKPWMKDVLYFLKSQHQSRSSKALKKKIFDLITNSASNDRRKREVSSDSSTPNAKVPDEETITELKESNFFWSVKQLEQISNETFSNTMEILGDINDFSTEQLKVLGIKAIEALGPVSQMTENNVMMLGCITRGFSNKDVETLPISLDTLGEIAQCGWTESEMAPMWRAVAKYNNLTAQQLGDSEMVTLNQFICGLDSVEIKQLNKDVFMEAVGSLDDIQCSITALQQLKTRAVSAFGSPKHWTEAQVSDLGNIIAGLNGMELASLDPSVFPFLTHTCIPLIPPGILAALSIQQLEAFGPDNADMISSKQRAALRAEQLSALDSAMTGIQDQTTKPVQSGAPSLTAEGILSFLKPLLFLLMGVLLL
uniref:otoancorin n=1 Tax=Semicossyphus pulcher TaxID=241346 RepID=UPI0037E7AB85